MTTFEHLLVEKQDRIAWVSIHRPKKLNALNAALLEELHQLFLSLKEEKDIRVIVLTGSGEKAFVAGADIAEFAQFDAQQGKMLSRKGQKTVFDLIAQSTKPVIAAINGFALGGGLELALSCHIRIASTNARMGLPETSLGVIPGYGGTQRLAQLIGRGRATEMILSCRMVTAEEALNVGLVSQVVSQEELLSSAAALAEKIMCNSSNAMGHALRAIDAAYQEGVAGFDRAKSVEDVGAVVLFEDGAAEVLDVENDNCNNIHVGPVVNIAGSRIEGDVQATSHFDIHLYICPKKGTSNFTFYGHSLQLTLSTICWSIFHYINLVSYFNLSIFIL